MTIPVTHRKINQLLCGEPIDLKKNFAKLKLKTTIEMIADETGLIHGGFIFGLADYCAMLAVNHPNVVLGRAEVEFFKPVRLNDILIAKGNVSSIQDRKIHVMVEVFRNDELVFNGKFICFTLNTHVLKNT